MFTLGWREDIRVGDPVHSKKVCFDAVSHSSPVTLYNCHGMRGNQLWRYRKVPATYMVIVATARYQQHTCYSGYRKVPATYML